MGSTSALAAWDYRGFTWDNVGVAALTGSFTEDVGVTLANPAKLLMRVYILGEGGMLVGAIVSSLGNFVRGGMGVFVEAGLFFGVGLSGSARTACTVRCQEDADHMDLVRGVPSGWTVLGVREEAEHVDPAR